MEGKGPKHYPTLILLHAVLHMTYLMCVACSNYVYNMYGNVLAQQTVPMVQLTVRLSLLSNLPELPM